MRLGKHNSVRYPVLRRGLESVRPLALAGLLLACAVLVLGYGLGLTLLYRPLIGGPATHPLTALGLAFLGVCGFLWSRGHLRREAEPFAWLALALGAVRLADIYLGLDMLGPFTPFQALLEKNRILGTPIATGANTAAMLTMFAMAAILNCRSKPMASQILVALALGFPFISLVGYAYGLSHFYGRMALSTVLIALPVGFAILLASAQRGFMHAILSPWIAGRIARIQLFIGFLVPILLGFGVQTIALKHGDEMYGLLIVLINLFIGGMITYSAMVQESIDQKRRAAERRLNHVASRDPLTGLPNRRHLFDQASAQLARAAREKSPLSLLMLDIDHFKRLNDQHGHMLGDQVLIRLARLIEETVRGQDVPARFGGEEFVILLPNTQLEGAMALAEKLRARIETGCHDLLPGEVCAVTVSIGSAQFDASQKNLQALIKNADQALYRAKSLGRNRVEPAYPSELSE
jgi:diguanylate cyclase (GGDEF)-like protein